MKRLVIIMLLLPFTSKNLHLQAQTVKTSKRVTSTFKTYQDLDTEKWKEQDDEWFYNGQKTGLSPLFYKRTKQTIDTIRINEGFDDLLQTTCVKETKSSTGLYSTDEPNWRWSVTDTLWYFMNVKTNSFPPRFTKLYTEVTTTSNCNDKDVITKTVGIMEDNKVSSSLWRWDASNRIWLFENKKTDKLPPYSVINSLRSESTLE